MDEYVKIPDEQEKDEEDEKKEETKISPDLIISPIEGAEGQRKLSFLEVLEKLSPGRNLRAALDDIMHARTGALIVFDCPELKNFMEGGFRVNCKFTPQKLVELSKMDGATIISSDMKKILFSNTLLVPDVSIPTNETGTKHKAAERTSKQLGIPVIAVSERRGKITLFYDNKRYILQDAEALLRRATENLNILEKQREICNDLITNLNILEATNLVSVGDACTILQRIEMINRIMNTLKRHIIELGKEGAIIQMRVRELHKGVEELESSILRDYSNKPSSSKRIISNINFDGLLDINILSQVLFESSVDKPIFPKGYRILRKLNLTERETDSLINYFENLGQILNSSIEELRKVLRSKTENFKKELEHIKEQIMLGKKI